MGHPNVHKALKQSQVRKSHMGALRPNDPTQTRLVGCPHPARHDAPNRMDAHGRKWKMGRPNMHKTPGWSQLSKSDTGALGPNNPTRARLAGCPHPARHDTPDRMDAHGRKWKMGQPNVYKAPWQSQLCKIDMVALKRNDPT